MLSTETIRPGRKYTEEIPKMKKEINYLILLLMTVFMVGCTNVEEDVPITNAETKADSQEVGTVNTNQDSEKEETVATVADEPVVDETPVQQTILTVKKQFNSRHKKRHPFSENFSKQLAISLHEDHKQSLGYQEDNHKR